MGAKADTIKVLSAAVHVNVESADGKIQLQQAGWGPDAKPILEPKTSILFLSRGDALPANLADGEYDRLKELDAIGTKAEAAAFSSTGAAPAPAEPEAPAELGDLAAMDDAQLAALYESKPPTVSDLLAAVGDDPALAQRVLDAEKAATDNDPRKTLVEGLDKVIEGA